MTELTKKMVTSVLFAIRKLMEPLGVRVDALEKALRELPVPKDGKDGDRGERGETGKGEKGDKGDPGDTGRDGRDAVGEPGRDALQIEILPTIDESRSYARGTFASFRGGIVRSLRNTDPLQGRDLSRAGWAVIVQGIASESEEFSDDGRTEKRITEYTDGTKLERTVTRAIVLYRGVFEEGVMYAKGDGISFGGSFWIAQTETQDKPGTSQNWRLSVKKGRDGRDGVVKPTPAPTTIKLPR